VAHQAGLLSLECEAVERVKNQPCSGTNTHAMELLISGSPGFDSYRELKVHNGCFGFSIESFGLVHNVREVGDKVHFTLRHKGSFNILNPNLPIVDESGAANEDEAAYDVKTRKLTIETAKQSTHHQSTVVMKCVSK